MTQFAIGTFLFGAIFGLRFKVLIMIPVMLASSLMVTFTAIVEHETLGQALETNVICAFTLQAGYLVASVARCLVAASRAHRLSIRSVNTVRSA